MSYFPVILSRQSRDQHLGIITIVVIPDLPAPKEAGIQDLEMLINIASSILITHHDTFFPRSQSAARLFIVLYPGRHRAYSRSSNMIMDASS